MSDLAVVVSVFVACLSVLTAFFSWAWSNARSDAEFWEDLYDECQADNKELIDLLFKVISKMDPTIYDWEEEDAFNGSNASVRDHQPQEQPGQDGPATEESTEGTRN